MPSWNETTRPPSPEERLRIYLERCRRRFAFVLRLRVATAGVAILVVCHLAGAAAIALWVPPEGWVLAARVGLYALAAALVAAVVLARVKARGAAAQVERRASAFNARLSTWLDASRRAKPPALLPRLAADTLRVARAHPPARVVPAWRLAAPLALLAAAALLLGWVYAAAPQSLRLPAERLLLGDALGDTRPRIVVDPGDTAVQRGADVLVSARAQGFAADGLRLHASFAGAQRWERVDMLPAGDGSDGEREFVLVSVTQPVSYFVTSGGVKSPRYRVQVADLPVVERLEVALRYPAWTRLDPRNQSRGDVSGVAGTEVRVRVHGSRPLAGGHLVLGDETRDLDAAGRGGFTIGAPGTWHVAALHLGERVRISDNFLIEVVADQRPQVEFVFPGRDRSATAIEEVALRFQARDDFGVDALTLRYAVNGGNWRQQEGAAAGGREAAASHLVAFETLLDDHGRSVRPGDVLAFYAEAKDHAQAARTALYFVDVRPFDRRYREGQGGGNSGGRGNSGLELSARQRDIVAATWNLIRDRDTGTREEQDFRDQQRMVTALQRALREQVETLVARAEGRRLSEEDEVESFVVELTAAAAQMTLAADTLAAGDLDGAVPVEQRALQHLLTAEASLRDINVSLASGASESGNSASRSLAELVDLELDPERNRYETPQQPTFGQRAESNDDEWRRLTELARRQEALARRQEREERWLPESRWQLERLEDELQSLRERLERQAGRQSNRGGAQSDAASTRLGDARGRQPGERELRSALAEIERARGSVQRAREEQRADAATLRQAAAALRAGAQRLQRDAAQQLAERMRGAERAAGELLADQDRIVERLRALRADRLREAEADGALRVHDDAMRDAAQTKRRMQRDLATLGADLADVRQQLDGGPPAPATQIDKALEDLAASRLGERLATAAEYFEAGRSLFLVGHEEGVREALAALERRVGRAAEELASVGAASGAPTVDDVRELRERLRAAMETGNGGGLISDIARDIARLEAAVFAGDGIADPQARERAAEGAAGYRGLGADAANRDRLVEMAFARLDQIEIALGKVEGAAVQAGRPRDHAHDSQQVARYFRLLSCGQSDGC